MDKNEIIKQIYEKYADEFNSKIASLPNYLETYNKLSSYIMDQDKILDLACGPANISKYIKQNNKSVKITGIDFSESLLKIARQNVPDGVFLYHNLRDLNIDELYDVVLFGFGLPYLDLNEFEELLEKIYKLLKVNGIFYISFMDGNKSGYEKSSFTGNDLLYVYYHPKEMVSDILKKYQFKFLDEFVVDYKEKDGTITKDVIYILRK